MSQEPAQAPQPTATPEQEADASPPSQEKGMTPQEASKHLPPEIGGPKGPEPTRYGDWEQKGRATDF